MSEKIIIQLIWAGSALLIAIAGMLTFIAVSHDGTNEALIVSALIGLVTTVGGLIAALTANWMGGMHVLNGVNSTSNTVTVAAPVPAKETP